MSEGEIGRAIADRVEQCVGIVDPLIIGIVARR
jgi:hypothetical protein